MRIATIAKRAISKPCGLNKTYVKLDVVNASSRVITSILAIAITTRIKI